MVAGASRGCGRGVAVALGEQAATVYVTGRSIRGGPLPVDGTSGTIEETAEEVTRRGGLGIPLQIDHTKAGESKILFDQVQAEFGRWTFSSVPCGVATSVSSIRYGSSPSGTFRLNSGTTSWVPGPKRSGSRPASPHV